MQQGNFKTNQWRLAPRMKVKVRFTSDVISLIAPMGGGNFLNFSFVFC